MSLYTDLQSVLSNAQQRQINAHESYMDYAGPLDVKAFLTKQAQQGLSKGLFHIEKIANFASRKSGFMSLSGQIGTLHPENTRGVIDRNGVGWFYFNMPNASTQQFQDQVNDLITYLASEGLTVESSQVGTTMADIEVSWT